MDRLHPIIYVLLLFMFVACTTMEESQLDKLKAYNEINEPIYRHHDEHFFHTNEVVVATRKPYPWEPKSLTVDKKITKEYFRCRGSAQNPPRQLLDKSGKKCELHDCDGLQSHGLPYRDGKEFIYPILIDLLNHLQEKTGRRVVITSGYRCPKHNQYADDSQAATTSKHQIGAEVDFYVEDYEQAPLEIVRWIMEYYSNDADPEFSSFRECRRNPLRLQHPGWYNREVAISVKQADEGRDFDNRHPYPYITLELRSDREKKDRPVQYNWKIAHEGYTRH